jgi:TolA-binding protein
MSSDRCEDLLLDLASDALGGEDARVARAEVEGCAEHAPALRRVELGLRFAALMPMEEPSPALDAAILAAARAKLEAKPVAAAAAAVKPALFARALAVLRRIATGPQLAMSTVMLLVFAIGLWYLPSPSATPNADGDTVMSPRLAEETSPPPPPMAEPVPARRAAPSIAAPAEGSAAPSGTTKPAPRARYAQAEVRAATGRRSRAARSPGTRGARARRQVAASAEPSAPVEAAEADAFAYAARATRPSASGYGAGAALGGAPAPAAAPPPASRAAADDVAATREAEAQASPYDQAMALYRAGRYAEAAPLFDAVSGSGGAEAASAAHYLARSHARSGRYSAAAQDYERLLRSHPSYGQRAQAMIEAADCYEHMGRLAQAEQWLERATASAPSSSAARAELARVRTARRAQESAASVERARAAEPTE